MRRAVSSQASADSAYLMPLAVREAHADRPQVDSGELVETGPTDVLSGPPGEAKV
ncbi:hypothetical protein [Cystobacter fuscus]|uniref:hypothetical protein n=1 Tax=Cystobacter fuscus TaxID=43 RepID=UPI0012FE7C4B|nr:hypothetical protein [Cystobacter fuscus]